MRSKTVAILGAGMVTGVGYSTAASCAAIRCGINNFRETDMMGPMGELIVGSEVALGTLYGRAKLISMLAKAVQECLSSVSGRSVNQIPIILNLGEKERPSYIGDGLTLLDELQQTINLSFHRDSRIIVEGRIGGAIAIEYARDLLHRNHSSPDCVVVAGLDSYLFGPELASLIQRGRLLTAENSDGFIPGEAAAAVLLGRTSEKNKRELVCSGIGFGRELASIESEEILRADGLFHAIKVALGQADRTMGDLDFRFADLSGEQYGFKEAALALARTLRIRKDEFEILHPADCIGEVGAAVLPCILGVAYTGVNKSYLPGSTFLCHIGNDDGRRAALVFEII